MTKLQKRKFEELQAITAKYLPMVKTGPISASASKYYPALKCLADK